MSLFLNLREWVSLDEAMEMAANEGIFPIEYIKQNGTHEAIEARWQLLASYTEKQYPIRLDAGGNLFIKRASGADFIKEDDATNHPDVVFDLALDIPYRSPIKRNNRVYAFDAFSFLEERGERGCLYFHENRWEGDSYYQKHIHGFSVMTWLTLFTSQTDNTLAFKTASLRELFANAKGSINTGQSRELSNNNGQTRNEDGLPPKTANVIYKEYLAMAETIASLSNKKPTTRSDLAKTVLEACAKAGHAMPVSERTVKSRLDRA